MKAIVHITKNNPAQVEEIVLEDIASYEVTDSTITIHFNGSPDEVISLVNTEMEPQNGEWTYINIAATRIGLKIDLSK